MDTLQRLLATSVVEALEQREHVVIAPGGTDALRDEVEDIIAPSLPTITTHLEPNRALLGEVTSTFGHEAADEAVEKAVDTIAEQLMESDHVDDIFAEDRLIRRDAFRAIQAVLLRYVRGEIEIDDDEQGPELCTVELDRLGYLVSTVSRRAEPSLIESSLKRAAQSQGVELVGWMADDRIASFAMGDNAVQGRLPLEEAITERFVDLVDADLVELPTMERILRMPALAHQQEGFTEALRMAARRTQQQTGCAAACTVVDGETLLATLTPLSEDASQIIDSHFETFLDHLEGAIAALGGPRDDGEQEAATEKPSHARRSSKSDARKAKRASTKSSSSAGSSRSASKPPSSRKPAKSSAARSASKAAKGAASRATKAPSSRKPAKSSAARSASKSAKGGASRSAGKATKGASSRSASKAASSRKPASSAAPRKPRSPASAKTAGPSGTAASKSSAAKPTKRARAKKR